MKILVCISSVPDTTSKINFTNGNSEFDKNGIQFVINPYDEFGLTKAMIMKEANSGKVTVVTVGEKDVEPVMRKALAIGADEAVRIDMDPKDSFSVATAISKYIKENDFDIVIAGRESTDYNGGNVPAMISEIIGLPFVNACIGLELVDGKAKLVREIDGGKENVECNIPFIIGGQKGLVEESDLRIPNMRGIMQSRNKPLNVIDYNEEDKHTSTIEFSKPKSRAECKLIDSENVSGLLELLQNEAKVL